MTKFIYILLLILCFNWNCKEVKEKELTIEKNPNPTIAKSVAESSEKIADLILGKDTLLTYKQMKASVHKMKSALKSNSISKDSLSKVFEAIMINKIIPYWYGTAWTFEGHTSIPKKGTIACGYFVSTTLKDAGIKVNRYHLAQQSPINEAKTLALSEQILEIQGNSTKENIASLSKLAEGLYFIGFDQSHVGYLWKQQNQLYLIHSNYINAAGVIIEKINESEVFSSYGRFYIVELSNNAALLNNWVKDVEIEVVRG